MKTCPNPKCRKVWGSGQKFCPACQTFISLVSKDSLTMRLLQVVARLRSNFVQPSTKSGLYEIAAHPDDISQILIEIKSAQNPNALRPALAGPAVLYPYIVQRGQFIPLIQPDQLVTKDMIIPLDEANSIMKGIRLTRAPIVFETF